jgi:membrane protein implicated in regulation of membrane protease activity
LATSTHKRREEKIRLQLLAFELVERSVMLLAFLLVTITAAVATVVCVVKGYPWPVPSITSVASTTALVVRGRQSRHRSDD